MSNNNEVIRVKTELDDTAFIKSLQEMKDYASNMVTSINTTLKSINSLSTDLSKSLADTVQQSNLLTSAFESLKIGSSVFQFANESIVPFVKSFETAKLQVSLFSMENDILM